MNERLAKALAYIEEHKNDPKEELLKQFSGLAEQFNNDISGLSSAQFDFKASEKEWSIRELCLHVSHSMRGGGSIISILAGGTTLSNDVAPGELDEDPGNQETIIANVEEGFQKVRDAFSCLDGTEDLEATFKHPFFGPINSRQTASFNILHISIHVKQLQRIKGYDDFPA